MMKPSINKILYIGFVILALYYAIFKSYYSESATCLGIALAFDPFDQEMAWQNRPWWQRTILILQLTIIVGLFSLSFLKNP